MASGTERKKEEKEFTFVWKIPHWNVIHQNINEVLKQKFIFTTQLFPTADIAWEVGFSKHKSRLDRVILYQKLVKMPDNFSSLDTAIKICLINNVGGAAVQGKNEFSFQENNLCKNVCRFYLQSDWSAYMDLTGSIKVAISLTVRFSPSVIRPSLNLEEVNNVFTKRTCGNWLALLKNKEDADLKILTSDGQEILAHKLVLKVQCPKFASIYYSEFSGYCTSSVSAPDISGKTMNVLLHYFYSGELLKSWCDEDVIVEFTSAVAKYEIHEFHKMLDNLLANSDRKYTWEIDWKLLNLVRTMSLEQAEKRLNDRILNITKSVQSADELLALFSKINMTGTGDDDGKENDLLVRYKGD